MEYLQKPRPFLLPWQFHQFVDGLFHWIGLNFNILLRLDWAFLSNASWGGKGSRHIKLRILGICKDLLNKCPSFRSQAGQAKLLEGKNVCIDYFIYLCARTKNAAVWLIAFTLTSFKTFKLQWDLWHWEWDLWKKIGLGTGIWAKFGLGNGI